MKVSNYSYYDTLRLHYNFRLERTRVLKSWAVPKGLFHGLKVEHLAMMVDDHPFDYLSFEGIIPSSDCGGGIVVVWDKETQCGKSRTFLSKT